MNCPDCQSELKVALLKGINIHECLKCKGKWFERKELILAQNKVDEGLRWLDFDPFGKDADKLSVVATNSVDETVDATPAPVDHELFIRGERHLFCIAAAHKC